jgi:hypothetical protein
LRFSKNSNIKTHTVAYYAYLNFQNKSINALSNANIKFIVIATFLFFIDVGEDLIMVNDVTTSSNPLVMPIQDEEFEEALFDVNVSQQPREKNKLERWCTLEWLTLHGIVKYCLTLVFVPSTYN